MSVAKPQLRGLLQSQIKRNLIIGIALSIGSGLAWKFGVMEPRKKKYADFYRSDDDIIDMLKTVICKNKQTRIVMDHMRTYDADKDFERMRKAGVFDSCPADD